MSQTSDVVLMTKGAAIEATATLANSFPSYLEDRIGPGPAAKARKYTSLCSTVRDALIASSVGIRAAGVTSMHDATEGGVLGGLDEMAHASGHAFFVHKELIHVPEESRLTCLAFAIDPLVSLSEGTLLLTCKEERAAEVSRKLRRNGIPVFAIGTVAERGSGLWSVGKGGKKTRLLPKRDPYWPAYARAAARRLA
jgi:hydrogenase maturation factor